ncbi:MAG: hypothetical protein WED15_00555, partial [Akkermansiaceae bacterium]
RGGGHAVEPEGFAGEDLMMLVRRFFKYSPDGGSGSNRRGGRGKVGEGGDCINASRRKNRRGPRR